MWYLMTAMCVMFQCSDAKVLASFNTQKACYEAMIAYELKDGEAAMCIEKESIKT